MRGAPRGKGHRPDRRTQPRLTPLNADADGLRKRLWGERDSARSLLTRVLLRIAIKLAFAARATKVVGLSLVRRLCRCLLFINLHAADRISVCRHCWSPFKLQVRKPYQLCTILSPQLCDCSGLHTFSRVTTTTVLAAGDGCPLLVLENSCPLLDAREAQDAFGRCWPGDGPWIQNTAFTVLCHGIIWLARHESVRSCRPEHLCFEPISRD